MVNFSLAPGLTVHKHSSTMNLVEERLDPSGPQETVIATHLACPQHFLFCVQQTAILCTYYHKMKGEILETVSQHPYLGVELSDNLKFNNHIDNITKNHHLP